MSKLICQERYAFLLSVCAPLCVYFPIREKVWNKIKVHHNFIKIDGGGAYKFNHIRNFISRFIIYWILKCRHLSKARYSGNVILWTIFVSEIKYQVDFQICIVNFSRNNGQYNHDPYILIISRSQSDFFDDSNLPCFISQ